MTRDFADDIALIDGISAVPSILEVVCEATGMGFAAVARVTEDRWIACSVRDQIAFGLAPGGELKIETTICNEIRQHREIVVIDDVATDPVYRDHHTPAMYGLRGYISMPIVLSDGTFFGTLCAIDPQPAHVSRPHIVGMFKLFADMIGHHIEAHQNLAERTTDLIGERETSALREQFIAVLGHDLRNPLAGIGGAMRYLEREKLSERGAAVVAMVNQTVDRMTGLIDNVMDFARGRLGGGITLMQTHEPIVPILRQIIAELRVSMPDVVIKADLRATQAVDCDPVRIGQLFSNLLGNAVTHGAPDKPIPRDCKDRRRSFRTAHDQPGRPDPERRHAQVVRPIRPRRSPPPACKAWAWGSTSLPKSPKPTVGP